MQRPVGLTIIAFMFFLGGAGGVLASILMLLPKYVGTTNDRGELLLLSTLGLLSIVQLVLGIGLWGKRDWARRASIIWGIVWVLGGFLTEITFAISMPSVFHFSWWQVSIAAADGAFEVWAVVYLLTPRVRGLFLSRTSGA